MDDRTLILGVACPDDDPVLAAGIELARALDASPHVVHAFHAPASVNGKPLGPAHAELLAEAQQFRLESAVRERFPGEEIVCHAVEGSASECLAELVHVLGAELVVVGAPRDGRDSEGRPGVTAEALVRRVDVPVVLLDASSGGVEVRVLGTGSGRLGRIPAGWESAVVRRLRVEPASGAPEEPAPLTDRPAA